MDTNEIFSRYHLLPNSDYKLDFYEEDGIVDNSKARNGLNYKIGKNAEKFHDNIKEKLFTQQKDGTFQFRFKDKAYFILGNNLSTINKILVKGDKFERSIKQKKWRWNSPHTSTR